GLDADHGPAARAREGQDPRRAHPVQHARHARDAGPARRGAGGGLFYFSPGVRGPPRPGTPGESPPPRGPPPRAPAARRRPPPPPPADATALLALMLLHDARRPARLDAAGDVVLLEDQDRGRWNHAQIAEALPLVEEALRDGPRPYALQAAIAALHCQAA